MRIDLSSEGKPRVVLTTIVGTLICVAVAVIIDSYNFPTMSREQIFRSLTTDIVVPFVLAVPLLWWFASKLRQLAIAHRNLAEFAATDSLTKVMSRAAFSTLVEAYLDKLAHRPGNSEGALLIVDADEFKSINDRFGHDNGDTALVSIARSIRNTLRDGDIVGRIGGEEFGVFLPATSFGQAQSVAERIRQSVADCYFTPLGRPEQLSVSVGGAAFDAALAFDDLFRVADQQLYIAKRAGRNRTAMTRIVPGSTALAA